MRYAIFSDVHGNLQALEAVCQAYKKENIDAYYCLGDIVGYGANPNECIDMVRRLKAVSVAGNHDWAVLGRTDVAYFNPVAKQAVFWTKEKLTQTSKTFLESLELICKTEAFTLVHASLNDPKRFRYIFEIGQTPETFARLDGNVCFIGHTHIPGIFLQKGEKRSQSFSSEVSVTDAEKYIINAGSVGQPRDGNPLAAYCIYDTDQKKISIKRISYDIREAQKRILDAHLPEILAFRLAVGQ